MAPLEFRILGTIAVERAGRALPLSGARQRTLLALLLVHPNEILSSDQLVMELWGTDAPPAARKRLQMVVARLRTTLGDRAGGGEGEPIVLESAPGGYRLVVERERIDAVRFERLLDEGSLALDAGAPERAGRVLREALALWRGPPLADVAYEGFAQAECVRLEELRVIALERRIDSDLRLGRHAALVGELEGLARRHPTREHLLGQLMLALYRSGRQEEALDLFHRARARLLADLGLEPGVMLRTLQARILEQDPSLDLAPRAAALPHGSTEPAQPTREPASRRAQRRRRWSPRRRVLLAAAAGMVPVAVIAGMAALHGADRASPSANLVGSRMAILDVSSRRIEDQITLRSRPEAMTAFAGSVWTASGGSGTVDRIDAESLRIVDTITVGGRTAAIASGLGAVWAVSASGGVVAQVNPRTNTVVRRVRVGNGARALAVGESAVWVANGLDATVSRIDPRTGRTTATIPVGATPAGVATSPGAVWVANEGDGTVTRIDPVHDLPEKTVQVGSGPASIAASRSATWVVNAADETVSRIDGRDSTVTATTPVPGARAVALSAGVAWVASANGTVAQLDAATGRVAERVAMSGVLTGLLPHRGKIWLANEAARDSRRGGTLTVRGRGGGSIDPATADDAVSWSMLAVTGDGLLTHRRVEGAGGVDVVADLATGVPEAIDGGMTYHFQLRRGIRYSDGRAVRARDVRASIERLHRMGAGWMDTVPLGLRGESRCGRRACDLSEAIVVDDVAETVTFRLARPNPNFLVNLASPTYAVLPAGTPDRDMTGPSLPATGPYRVGSAPSNGRVVLVRNRLFRQWSEAAQPAGLADRIVWRFAEDRPSFHPNAGGPESSARDDVVLYPSYAEIQRLAVSAPDRVHTRPVPLVMYMWLNTRTAPFNDPDVRRALAFATDRSALARFGAEYGQVQATCQLLTPNVGGYEPYCPLTSRPRSASASAPPDMDAARRLVERSGTARASVTVSVHANLPGMRAIGEWYVRVLRKLGYRSQLVARDPSTYFERTADPHHRMQIGGSNWIADSPLASHMLPPLVRCSGTARRSSFNQSHYCNRSVDAMMRRAASLQQGDPAGSAALWARVDRAIVDSAPVIPLFAIRDTTVTSERVVEYQVHERLGPLLSQIQLTCDSPGRC